MPPVELHVTEHPSSTPSAGPLVVLVHGAPDRSSAFRTVVSMLADLDVVTYDRRGYGRSIELPLSRSLDDHVADLLTVIRDRPVTLVGHSFGCNVVMATAIRRPDLVRSAGTWELPIPWVGWWPTPGFHDGIRTMAEAEDPEDLGEQWGRGALGDDGWEGLRPDQRDRLRAEGRAYQADMRSIVDAPYDIDELRVPTVFAAGAATTTGHREAARILAARIAGAKLMEVEDAGHFGPSQHPEAFAAMVRRAVALGWPTT